MNTAVTVVLVIVVLFVVLGVLARSSSRRKKEAQADLEREKAELQTPDILELVRQEAAESGVDEIPGADGVDLSVRLRVWQRDEHVRSICPDPTLLRFVLEDGVSPDTATADDLRLECEGIPTPAASVAPEGEVDTTPEDAAEAATVDPETPVEPDEAPDTPSEAP